MSRSREKQREYMRAYRARKRAEKAAEVAAAAPEGATPPARAPRHLPAVERMLRETGLGESLENAPLVELMRELAAELDADPNVRTRQQYLTALRDARRVLAAAPGVPGAGGKDDDELGEPAVVEPESPAVDPEVADFASFRRAKGGAAVR